MSIVHLHILIVNTASDVDQCVFMNNFSGGRSSVTFATHRYVESL